MDLPAEMAPKPAIARAESIPAPRKADPYGPSIKALVRRLMDQKQAQGMSEAQIGQMTKVYVLFSEITGIRDIRQIKQAPIAQFVAALRQLDPPPFTGLPLGSLTQCIADLQMHDQSQPHGRL
ncbi:hypothetical protein F8A10_12585 [Paracoccus kondratievae]|nr:hypothetical protein F8A10_12585 [Paracoccus kondratievae]